MKSTQWARCWGGSALAITGAFVLFAACGGSGGGGGGGGVTTTGPSPVLTGLTVNPTSVGGTTSSTGTVTLSTAAPSSGTTVSLQASPSSAGSVPGSVVVSSGATNATFNITTNDVGSGQTLTVTATLDAVSMNAPLNVTVAAITARFVVTPDSGTQANAGQCSVTNSNDANNPVLLQCTFDAANSVPKSGISTYQWVLPGQSAPITSNSPQLKDPKLTCPSALTTANVQLPVKLTVSGSAGTNSTGNVMVLFTKAGPC